MKRVLSFLLLIPFFVTQAWALRGGPYDSPFGYSQAPLAGTYGVSLQALTDGTGILEDSPRTDSYSPSLSTTGVMTMVVPTSGITQARVLIFERGLFYFGSANGRLDFQSGKMRLLSQLSHYLTAQSLSAGAAARFLAVDYMLSGQIDLQLSLDYFSGVIQVDGGAVFALTDVLLKGTLRDADTTSTTTTTVTTEDATVTSGSGTTTTTTTTATQAFHPEDFAGVRQPVGLFTMTANGVREDTVPITLPTFTSPTDETAFQITVEAAKTGAAGN